MFPNVAGMSSFVLKLERGLYRVVFSLRVDMRKGVLEIDRYRNI